jgi:TetR/AcrR family transcriptional regulator, cholesterol catabolism regulator
MARVTTKTADNGRAARSARTPNNKRRQDEVVAAAVKMFYESGYSETSVEDIANELGILKGSLYYYIASKEDLLYAIVREVHSEVEGLLNDAMSDTSLPPLERLSTYVSAQVEYNAHNAMKITVYYDDLALLGPERLKQIRRSLHAMENLVQDLIREAQEAGEIDKSLDPVLASHAVFATVNWIYRWYKPRGRLTPAEIAAFVVQYILNGLTGARIELPTG